MVAGSPGGRRILPHRTRIKVRPDPQSILSPSNLRPSKRGGNEGSRAQGDTNRRPPRPGGQWEPIHEHRCSVTRSKFDPKKGNHQKASESE